MTNELKELQNFETARAGQKPPIKKGCARRSLEKAKTGWSPERRARQHILMLARAPWKKSTGPKTAEGKAKSARNAHKHGYRGQEWCDFLKLLARQRAFVRACRARRLARATISVPSIPVPQALQKRMNHRVHREAQSPSVLLCALCGVKKMVKPPVVLGPKKNCASSYPHGLKPYIPPSPIIIKPYVNKLYHRSRFKTRARISRRIIDS